MAKGIVSANPKPTKGKVRIAFINEHEETHGSGIGDELDYSDHSGAILEENDTVDFTIDAQRIGQVTGKFEAHQAIVTSPPGSSVGKAKLKTLPYSVFGLKIDNPVIFDFFIPPPIPLPAIKENDIIEIIPHIGPEGFYSATGFFVKVVKSA